MRMFQTFTDMMTGKKRTELTENYYWTGTEIRRRIGKVKGKANKKTAKMQRIWDRGQNK